MRTGGLARLLIGAGWVAGAGAGAGAPLVPAQEAPPARVPGEARLAGINSAGRQLDTVITVLDVEHHWPSGQGVDWRTGRVVGGEPMIPSHAGAFVAACAEALDAPLLHPPEHTEARLATAQVAWLLGEGRNRGWRPIGSLVQAQSLANEGYVVLALLASRHQAIPGQAAIIRPGTRDRASIERDGPDAAFAGRTNRARLPLRDAFDAAEAGVRPGPGDEAVLFAHASFITGAGDLDARLAREFTAQVRTVPGRVARAVQATAAALPDDPTASLAMVLAGSLPAWATFDGRVRREHLQALAADPGIRGERAVALATLIHHFGKDSPDSFRLDEFDRLADRRHLEHAFRQTMAKLPEIRRTLFVDGRPRFNRLHQGSVGDCYFISGAGWMVRNHPDQVVEMIRTRPDGRLAVKFPGHHEVIVEPPTDTEILLNAARGTLADGLWLAVLEKALGVIRTETDRKLAAIPDPVLRINGGSGAADITLWTGQPTDSFDLNHPDQVDKVHLALRVMHERRLMAQTGIDAHHAPGPLPHSHDYALMDFDPDTDQVTIWNPWGDDFTPKGPPSSKHGWPRRDGVFTLPFADYIRAFSRISIERRP